jgi:hypothetical protein
MTNKKNTNTSHASLHGQVTKAKNYAKAQQIHLITHDSFTIKHTRSATKLSTLTFVPLVITLVHIVVRINKTTFYAGWMPSKEL